jgi:hypothetical protein
MALDDIRMKVVIHNAVGHRARNYLIEIYSSSKYD